MVAFSFFKVITLCIKITLTHTINTFDFVDKCRNAILITFNPDKFKSCPLLNKCTENRNYTIEIRRLVWQDDLNIIEDLRFLDTIKKVYKLRSQKVERRFSDTKEQHGNGMRWTRYRGIKKFPWIAAYLYCHESQKLAMWLVKEPQTA
ncbi:transposase [Staphylococcus saprophyticus]|nr:transposase [Staphylococcus saprophyticus]MDW3992539.1 transposase [Staphylococcus saprophyticus]MDW4030013.1 transposase [Staphylococcus saprophyticus]MDW4085049.1 transposase [Staphylococcus saprophyticus]